MKRYRDAFSRGQRLAYQWIVTWPKALQPPADSDIGRRLQAFKNEQQKQPEQHADKVVEDLTEAQELAVQALRDLGMRKADAVALTRKVTNAQMSEAEAVTAVLRAAHKKEY